MFVDLAIDGVFVVGIIRGVSRRAARFVAAASITFTGWAATVTATSFPSAEMVICLFLKHFEGTLTFAPRLSPYNRGLL